MESDPPNSKRKTIKLSTIKCCNPNPLPCENSHSLHSHFSHLPRRRKHLRRRSDLVGVFCGRWSTSPEFFSGLGPFGWKIVVWQLGWVNSLGALIGPLFSIDY
ncbi:hypothetical protein Drorol1_Dr00018831 [Drosera rotundifolia]